MRKVTLGGERLGSGSKMQVELHGYERSTHDMGYIWRSTMSSGTLVPFLVELALPGDTFDINLDADIKTHPTIGPLFGSFKVQLDVFQCPIRLYHGQLHNNKIGIGMNMSQIKLPQLELTARPWTFDPLQPFDKDNAQINPSCILSYLGIRGIGKLAAGTQIREFNALPFLSYWDIYKNYYSNKQEEIGAVIHTPQPALIQTVDSITVNAEQIENGGGGPPILLDGTYEIIVNYTGASPLPNQIMIDTNIGLKSLEELATLVSDTLGVQTYTYDNAKWGTIYTYSWRYATVTELRNTTPQVATFPLENLDQMREAILEQVNNPAPFTITTASDITPYTWPLQVSNTFPNALNSQEGLALKTYQSDLFNNWLSTEWIDGAGGITELTAIDTSGGSFTLDTLNLSKKVYDMLNRIAVSGGTYDDWLDAVYDHDRIQRAESPIYHGGLIKELVFQEVVSNSESTGQTGPVQPLGTLAGKGIMGKKHKGGQVTIRVDEPSYILGIISLTPRIDYSQGNKWDTHLKTMDDLHKPALDEIGFQELITEQMAWWSTEYTGGNWVQKSAGKQPAWINYMTNVNQVRGNFAIPDNEMFMTLNRRYEEFGGEIQDLTTYIDPVKFNHIFAQTARDAQNYWAQIGIDMTVRRKMSAKIMPNL